MRVKNVIRLIVVIVLAVVSGADALTYTGGVEYSAGSGDNQATIAIDFDLDNSFLFTYRWDGEATGWDALTAITTDKALDVESTHYSWASSMDGVTDRALTDGAWDSWVWTNYEPDWGPPYRAPGQAPIPEPATFSLLCLGGFLLRRRTG